MINPEKMIDDERLAKSFNEGMDKIGYSFLMKSEEKLYFNGKNS